MQTTCPQCGLHKIQIAYASNKRAKEMMKTGDRGKIVKMRRRPSDVSLAKLSLRLCVGFFGVHNFYTGRKIRAWIALGCAIGFVLQAIFFPFGDINNNLEGMHSWRYACSEWGMPFPLDFLGVVPLVMWISDIIGIIFGWYKYPVRLGEVSDAGKIWVK